MNDDQNSVNEQQTGEYTAPTTAPQATPLQAGATAAEPVEPVLVQVEKASGMAIAALVLGIIAFISGCCTVISVPAGILSIIFAIVVMSKNSGRGTYPGKMMCIISIILSALGLISGIGIVIAIGGVSMNPTEIFEQIDPSSF